MLIHGNKGFTACTVKYWRDDTSKGKKFNKKTGQMEFPKVPMYIRRIWVEILTPTGNGMVWLFTGTRRAGDWRYSDGRNKVIDFGGTSKDKPLKPAELRAEISRMTNPTFADQVIAALESEVNNDEYAEMIGATFATTYGVRDVRDEETNRVVGSEDYEGRVMEGGYIDRMNYAIESVKAFRVSKVAVNKRTRGR